MLTKSNSIKTWADDDRPREKFIEKGKASLSNAELLAILIHSGTKEENAVDVAKNILKQNGNNLINLSKLGIKELTKYKGIGEAKAATIAAALELGNRRREAEVAELEKIKSSKDVFDIFYPSLSDCNYEEFWILLLNRANKVIDKFCISEGGLTGTVADPSKIFKIAIENKAVGVILCHNHPSGNLSPSEQDKNITKKLKEGGKLLDISVLDHIIIGDEKYFSFADEGLI
ncbi:MAG TPA: DNA repair protein RadC [Bacteroidales bacterium]|nr:DNA repair protein RadC [Bacteroidales bacterium]HPS17974.1 DNA repair protein RadC [Bacteroidales bacterium]